jgi:hypothetical protein
MRAAREKGLRDAQTAAANNSHNSQSEAANNSRREYLSVEKEEHPSAQASTISFWDSKIHAEGVAAVADICNGDSTFEVKRESPVFYHNFCELFGLNADPKRVFELRDKALVAGLTASVTPHSLYSLNRDAFAAAVAGNEGNAGNEVDAENGGDAGAKTAATDGGKTAHNADYKYIDNTANSPRPLPPLSIHFMESEEETDLFKKRGAMWQWYENQGFTPDFLDYHSPAERLTAQVPPDRPVMLIHNTAVTQRDIDIVRGHFTAPVTWVLCPRSNRHISKNAPPVQLLRKNGLSIAIGTDSLASNETLSVVREMAEIKDVPLEELLRWATINGARADGSDCALGSIEVGKIPGIALLTGVNMQSVSLTETSRAIRIV